MFYYFKFKFPFFSIYAAKLYMPTTYLPRISFLFCHTHRNITQNKQIRKHPPRLHRNIT